MSRTLDDGWAEDHELRSYPRTFTTADPDSGAYRDPEVYQTLTATRTGVTLSGGTVWRVDSNEVGFVGEYVGDEACEALAQAWEDVA